MRNYCLGIVFVFFSSFLAGQNQKRQQLPLNERPKIGTIQGKVADSKSKAGIPFASVALLAKPDSAIASGSLCDENGNFTLSEVPTGRFWLRVSFIGYETLYKDSIFIRQGSAEVNLNTIYLTSTSTQLKEFNVVENQDVVLQNIDKRVFNVDENIVTQGASATEVMQQIPGITVDADGGISLRGSSNLNVLIDGKPSALTGGRDAVLDQIPASAIEKIEIITNPSARYDADGGGGMINIVLKKNKKPGLNGSVNLNIGSREKYNASMFVNVSTTKWNLSLNYSYRNDYRYNRGINNRLNLFDDNSFYLNTNSDNLSRNTNNVVRLSYDYQLTKTLSATIGTTLATQASTSNGSVFYNYLDADEVLYARSVRFNNQQNSGQNLDLNGGFKKKFTKLKADWTFDFNVSQNKNSDSANYRQYYDEGISVIKPFQINLPRNKNTVAVFQTDYVMTIKSIKLESGLKYTNRIFNTDFKSNYRNSEDDVFQFDNGLSNNFIYDEKVAAAYGIVSGTVKKWSYQTGLRAEQTYARSELITTNTNYPFNYFGLFPSAYLLYKFNDKSEIRAGYSRRINRPNPRQLNPFPEFNDPFNLMVGNPFLKPEYTNSSELSYNFKNNNINIYSSIYNRYTTGVTQRLRSVNTDGVAITTFSNLNTNNTSGSELTIKYQPKKWVDLTVNGNIFYTRLNGTFNGVELKNENWNWNAKLISNFNTNKNASFQLSGSYVSPMVLAQGRSKPIYAFDLGFRKNITKYNLTLIANITDIFDTREFGMEVSGVNFISDNIRKRETRIITVGVTWRLGKTDFQTKKRSRRDESGSDGNNEMMDW